MTTEPEGPARPTRPQERDAAASVLAEVYAAGLIGKEEFDQRLDGAFTARTTGELARHTAGLPMPTTETTSADVAPRRRRERRQRRRAHHFQQGHRAGGGWAKALAAVALLAVVLRPQLGQQATVLAAALLAYAVVHRRRHGHGQRG